MIGIAQAKLKRRATAPVNVFAALDETHSDDSEDGLQPSTPCTAKRVMTPLTMTPGTMTPAESFCNSGNTSESEEEKGEDSCRAPESTASVDPGWMAVPQRRRSLPVRLEVGLVATGSTAQQVALSEGSGREQCDEDADDDWCVRKGQRHSHSKGQKQEWSFKAKARVNAAKQKRSNQRNGMADLMEE